MARRPARESQKVVGFAAKKLLPRAQGVKPKIMLGRTLETGSSRSYGSFVQPRYTHIVSTEECM